MKPTKGPAVLASPAATGSGDGGAGGFAGPHFNGAEDQIFEGTDEERRVADGRHHAVALNTGFLRVQTAVDIDLVKGFDVLGDK